MPFKPGESGNIATQWKPGQSGNPNGPEPGYKHVSTWIQEMLNKEVTVEDVQTKKKYQKVPMVAILKVAQQKAEEGDQRWADLLFKYGYGVKTEVQHSGSIDTGIQDPATAAEFTEFMKGKTKQ